MRRSESARHDQPRSHVFLYAQSAIEVIRDFFAGKIRKPARKSSEFPEQCVVSIRVSVGVAMRWTLVQLGKHESKRARWNERRRKWDRLAERGLECRQATLHLLYLLATTQPRVLRSHGLFLRPLSASLRPLLLLQIYKLSHSMIELARKRKRERERERERERNAPRGKFDRIGPLIPVSKKRARWLSLFSHSSEILPTILRLSLLFVFLYMVFLSSATLAARSLRLLFDLRVSSRK